MFSIGEFAQAGKLLNGITVEELRGMLALRRAQLEQELKEYTTRLREVEARLDYIEGENAMPADDIMVKKIPAMGVVAGRAPPPARYLVLPAIEAATAVRSGPASSIYPTPVHPPRSYTGLAAPWKIKSSKPSYRTGVVAGIKILLISGLIAAIGAVVLFDPFGLVSKYRFPRGAFPHRPGDGQSRS